MKKERKLNAFTLVELLVVIAILAVLATVSVVGYTSFINKANNSNALTECKQLEEVVLSDLISFQTNAATTNEVDFVEFDYDETTGKISFDVKDGTAVGKKLDKDKLEERFSDAANLSGNLYYGGHGENKDGETCDILIYRTANGKGYASWMSTETPAADAEEEIKTKITSNDPAAAETDPIE